MTTAVLPLAPERTLRTASLVHVDESLARFARDTCKSVAELGDLSDAVLGVMADGTDDVQVLADYGGGGLGRFVTHGPAKVLIRAAAESSTFVESTDHMLVATTASAERLVVVLLGVRADVARTDCRSLSHVLESAARVAALSLCDRIRLIERGQRLQVQHQTRLACALHDQVVQRLVGVSLILDAEEPLAVDLRAICSTEVERALAELRMIISSPAETEAADPAIFTAGRLRATLEMISQQGAEVDAEVDDVQVAPAQQAIACSILNEAVRNAGKHAEPERIRITVRQTREMLLVSVFNDGVRDEGRGHRPRGVGLQLAATEAALGGGVLERGPVGLDGWAVRLSLPLEERDDYRHDAGIHASGHSGGRPPDRGLGCR